MRYATVLLGLSLLAAPAAARERDFMGSLTFSGETAADKHVLGLTSLFFNVVAETAPSTPEHSEGSVHAITMTSEVMTPDPAMIAWSVSAEKRNATVEVNAGENGKGHSVLLLENAKVIQMTVGGSSAGELSQTLVIEAEHMTLNGQKLF